MDNNVIAERAAVAARLRRIVENIVVAGADEVHVFVDDLSDFSVGPTVMEVRIYLGYLPYGNLFARGLVRRAGAVMTWRPIDPDNPTLDGYGVITDFSETLRDLRERLPATLEITQDAAFVKSRVERLDARMEIFETLINAYFEGEAFVSHDTAELDDLVASTIHILRSVLDGGLITADEASGLATALYSPWDLNYTDTQFEAMYPLYLYASRMAARSDANVVDATLTQVN